MARLSMDEVQDLKELCNPKYDYHMCNLIETIESQQQEIGQLKDENASIRNWNACEEEDHKRLVESDKRRIKLEDENEQLKEQCDTLADTVNMFAPYVIGKSEAEIIEELKQLITLKQEIERLEKQTTTTAAIADHIKGLEHDNEQLKARNASMREALCNCLKIAEQACKHYCTTCPKEKYETCNGCPVIKDKNIVKTAQQSLLTDAGRDYHNPTDIEALTRAKKALEEIKQHKYVPTKVIAQKAIAEINKLIQCSTYTEKDYHNPDDVDALSKAREALEAAMEISTKYNNADLTLWVALDAMNAIAEIDKVTGGGQDERHT
jgi:hypothetical protein